MPSALLNNVSPPIMLTDKPRVMEGVRRKEVAVCPTDDDAIAPRTKKPHKQSLDYIWRTGVAGGLAGCAVCDRLPSIENVRSDDFIGKNSSRSS